MDFEQAPDRFGYIVFDRTDREANARRFYMIAWEATLIDDGAVVRTFGRKGGAGSASSPPPTPRCRPPGR